MPSLNPSIKTRSQLCQGLTEIEAQPVVVSQPLSQFLGPLDLRGRSVELDRFPGLQALEQPTCEGASLTRGQP
jgi:hypothetical protein